MEVKRNRLAPVASACLLSVGLCWAATDVGARSGSETPDGKKADSKQSDSKKSDSKKSDGRQSDGKKSDGNRSGGKKADSNKLDGWLIVIDQKPIGKVNWYCSVVGVKMTSPLFSVLVNSDGKSCYLFNSQNKGYTQLKDPEMIKKMFLLKQNHFGPWKKLGPSPAVNGQHVDGFSRMMSNPPVDQVHHRTSTYEERMLVSPVPDKRMSKFFVPISKLFADAPPVQGIPVRRDTIWIIYKDGKRQKYDAKTELQLESCKMVKFDRKEFEIPPDYRKCKTETEVLSGSMAFPPVDNN